MKCFHFSNGMKKEEDEGSTSRVSKVSWVRSLSVASSSLDVRRSEFDSDSRDLSDAVGSPDFFSRRRSNDLRVFGFSELRSATRGFSRALMIGEGGFGCVYRGVVRVSDDDYDPDSTMEVAVKQLNRNGLQGHKEWITEVDVMGIVKHPNLVRLVGYCAEDDERGIQRLLVYELMPNMSLEDHLLARVPSPLSWAMRLRIALDAAHGLAYLHEEMDFQLIFRDFKTSNILLDKDFNAKLSDFGLARQGPTEGLGHVSTSVVGTVGYAAPEYIQTGKLTAKSDVWSFGVVLYELITGRRSVDRNLPKSEQKLLDWVRPYIADSKKFHFIMDPRLEGQYCVKSARKLAALANKCLMKQPKSRPKMSEVVEMLGQIIETLDEESPIAIERSNEAVKEAEIIETKSMKEGNSSMRRVFDLRDMISLRNRSVGKLDWRTWTPGLIRTW